MSLEKTYNPNDIEQKWYDYWEAEKLFKPSEQGTPYCIMLPPPNVTGSLHMGHGFQQTLMDALIRYHRMMGDNTLWQVGCDHAGIATQMVVERQLSQEGTTRQALGREEFEKRVWKWKAESGNTIMHQMRRLGVSADWERECFTMDEGLSHAVQEVFISLYEEGLIYRGQRLVNWDTKFQTAISDLEVLSEEENVYLWHIRYPLTDGTGYLIVATTRPETMLGDVAVAVHPDDERYRAFIGKQVSLPLCQRTIPVIADAYVDPAFGTGCVKITPAHDFNDYDVGKRHQLPLINIFTPDAKINFNAPQTYQGLDRFVAREKIVEDLKAQGFLEKIAPHKAVVPRGDRSGDIIEPYLTYQWFVKTKPLAAPAIKAVEEGSIRFFPENWTRTYFQWMHNIEDWCISRQLWWGHRIPAWYDQHNNIYVGRTEAEIHKKYQLTTDIILHQDPDVLDTWFSSALWPFSTLGWPENTPELRTWYPTSVLVSGFDIIFFWIARMIMMGLKFTGNVPFREVYITGLVKDAHGQKMSKSKGNVLDPLDLIDGISLDALLKKRTYGLMQPAMAERITKATRQDFPDGIAAYGTDALRFTYCAFATNGRDIRFDLSRLEGYRNFCNKIWNAARFVLMNTEGQPAVNSAPKKYSIADRWVMSLLQETTHKIHTHFMDYRFDLLSQAVYEFTWNEYCDWYVELAKITLQQSHDSAKEQAARHTLLVVLETLLRLMHPLMPFITEEIWQKISPLLDIKGHTISTQSYPKVNNDWLDESVNQAVEWMKKIVLGIRNIRGEMNISPGKTLKILFRHGSERDREFFHDWELYIKTLVKAESIIWLDAHTQPPIAATSLVGELEILIPFEGNIDKTVEIARLNKDLEEVRKELMRLETKLANDNFIKRAPAEIVAKEKALFEEMRTMQTVLVDKINLLTM